MGTHSTLANQTEKLHTCIEQQNHLVGNVIPEDWGCLVLWVMPENSLQSCSLSKRGYGTAKGCLFRNSCNYMIEFSTIELA